MKKILFYVPSLSPAGGIERVVTTLANNISEYYDITILTKDNKSSFYNLNNNIVIKSLNMAFSLNMNSKILRVISQFKNIARTYFKLRSFLLKNEFDYIYITHPISHVELLLCRVNYKKIVISEHGASDNYNFIYRLIKRLTYKKCLVYCVPTKLDFDIYSKFGFPVKYTPHFRPNLNYDIIKSNNKIVLNIGRFTEDKKQLTLLKIWNSIDEDLRDGWLLKIVGCGELDGDLRDYINHNELESTVKLVEPCNNIESIYKSASIFALSSRSEGFGMVLLEAAGFGIPLIAFNCPSGPRDIINKSNGYLIDIDDCQSYRYELIRMMNDEKLLMSLSLGSVQTFNQWSDENISKIWLDILK